MATVLVVDDSRNLREFCRRELESEGYVVTTARGGEQAVQAVWGENPDLVVLDIRMPGMDGFEAIARISIVRPEVPVILYTAHPGDVREDYRSWLARAVVEKTEDLTELKATIARLLRGPGNGRPAAGPLQPGRGRSAGEEL